MMGINYSIQIADQAKEEDVRYVGLSLRDYNQSIIGEQEVHPFQMVILNEDTLIAGATGVNIWGWCCLEQFWVAPDYDHTDLKDQLLKLIQNEAVKYDIHKLHTKAIFEEEIEFYQKNYYQIFGELEDRPPGYTCYYFKSEDLKYHPVNLEPDYTFLLNNQVTQEYTTILNEKINRDLDKRLGPIPFKQVRLFARDGQDQIIGGLSGYIGWGWFYVSTLWVDERYRGQGLGRDLLTKGEENVLEFGVDKIFLGTTEFQARGFYEKNGYQVFATMDDLPPGYKNFMMRKNLVQISS